MIEGILIVPRRVSVGGNHEGSGSVQRKEEGHKTRGMPTDIKRNFCLFYSFPRRGGEKGQCISLGKAELDSKLFLKPAVSLN